MRSFFSVAFLTTSLVAQSIVFPSSHTNISNGAASITWFPFSNGISRMQIVYEGWDLGLAANTPITRIGFRQDAYLGAAPQRLLQMEVRMGVTLATASSLGTNYDNNFFGAASVVYPQALYTLPAIIAASPGIVWVNLTTPYIYPGGNLLVEFRVFSNNNGNAAFTYNLDQANFVSTVTAGVQGCLHSGNQRPVLTSQPAHLGGSWNLNLSTAPANTAIALFIAPGQQLTAPYSLQSLGLDPTCFGQLPLVNFATFSASTDGGGGANWSVPVPNNLAFNNFYMSSQVAALDFFVPGSLVVSNADQVQFGVVPRASILRSQGSATAVTGSVYANYGVVTLFN